MPLTHHLGSASEGRMVLLFDVRADPSASLPSAAPPPAGDDSTRAPTRLAAPDNPF